MLVDPLQKKKEGIAKFKETRDTNYIYKNKLDKSSFQHDMAYGDFKDLARRTASDKILRDKAFNIAKNPKLMHIKEGLILWITNFLLKRPLHLQINLLQAVVLICMQTMKN